MYGAVSTSCTTCIWSACHTTAGWSASEVKGSNDEVDHPLEFILCFSQNSKTNDSYLLPSKKIPEFTAQRPCPQSHFWPKFKKCVSCFHWQHPVPGMLKGPGSRQASPAKHSPVMDSRQDYHPHQGSLPHKDPSWGQKKPIEVHNFGGNKNSLTATLSSCRRCLLNIFQIWLWSFLKVYLAVSTLTNNQTCSTARLPYLHTAVLISQITIFYPCQCLLYNNY